MMSWLKLRLLLLLLLLPLCCPVWPSLLSPGEQAVHQQLLHTLFHTVNSRNNSLDPAPKS
jgi:hypothetical protein